MNNYPIILVKPKSLIIDEKEFSEVICFDDKYFNSIRGYNKLMMSSLFYETFIKYEYILIHQLDSYIFSDKLDYWSKRSFSYVGSPWINWADYNKVDNYAPRILKIKWFFKKPIHLVGNGGLSLRRVSEHLAVARFISKINYDWNSNEDVFWSLIVPTYNPLFTIPRYEEALKFGFDCNPIDAYKLNNCDLPFGCHGWSKYKENFLEYVNLYG